MYLLFLVCFIFVSFFLIFLIFLQPAQGLNNIIYSNIKNNNNKSFRYIKQNSFILNLTKILSFLFFVITILLCNINHKKIDSDLFLENDIKNNIFKKNVSGAKY